MFSTPTNQAYFEELEGVVKAALDRAQTSVRVCVAWITYSRYAEVFRRLVARGVSIDVIINDDHINRNGFPDQIEGVRQQRLKARQGLMHSKFCVIDDHVVLAGSFNWSANAERHHENLQVCTHAYALASSYIQRFDELWKAAASNAQETLICGYDNGEGPKCCASAFHLGLIGGVEGEYQSCTVAVWRICHLHRHAQFIGESSEDFLLERLGLNIHDYPDWDEYGVSIESEASRRMAEQGAMRRTSQFFSMVGGAPVHAVGRVLIMNEMEHLQFNEEPEYGLRIFWKDVQNAYRICSEYHSDGSGIDDVIEDNRGGW